MKKYFLFIILINMFLLAACGEEEPVEEAESVNEYETIELEQVTEYQNDGYTVVDVREEEEYQAGHIEDAINKPLSELREDDLEPLNKKESYVIICETGNRSQEASDILINNELDVVNVEEGMSTWEGEVVTE
ncbi:rhodanese-like domain-containing protein [Halalkalibacillus halophilus]|uniref:rhodanese-like domain-containing protein n=1 Tax=Halalkalibacillus halophilus TaxID=392827 RepID=UPI0004042F5C|nr:rhodanese-like domain-containing protein [Halalkalibacillus halophilus]